jgi:hypothetical protein
MPSFFTNIGLSRGDLSLFLRNDSGLPQDGYDVRWTISKKSGELSSGSRVPAVKANTGEYFAPWGCSRSGGCYVIKWEYRAEPNGAIQSRCQEFFVININCRSCSSSSSSSSSSSTNCGAFFSGQSLGPNGLYIKITDEDGLPSSAFAVYWTIYNQCGIPVTSKSLALPGSSLGDYYAPWTVCGAGEYSILWEWMLESDSALEATRSPFSIFNPPALFFSGGTCCLVRSQPCCTSSPCQSSCGTGTVVFIKTPPNFCDGCPPMCCSSTTQVIVNKCDDEIEIPRVVHLATQILPVAGQFTNQSPYAIPHGIRKIAFYITYSRGAVGGFIALRLKWGNGSEETQATIIDRSAIKLDGEFSAQAMRLSDLMGPMPPDDSPVSFMLEASVPGGSSTVRLLAAEGGVPGLPGTVSITLTASSD